MIISSRKPMAIKLCELLGIKIIKRNTYEGETIAHIQRVFQCEDMITEHRVAEYRIDLYFPKYHLAIECDEGHHTEQLQAKKDASRESAIQKELGCTFIRYEPHRDGFDVFVLLSKIYAHINAFNK